MEASSPSICKYLAKDGERFPMQGEYLYNLAEDPGEKNNLMAKHPDIAQELRQMYVDWNVW